MTTDYKDYNKLIKDIIESGLVTEDNSWEFCNQLFIEINKIPIEEYLNRLARSQAFTEITKKVCAEKSAKANQEYLDKLTKGAIKVKYQKIC